MSLYEAVLTVTFASEAEFLEHYDAHISRGKLFAATDHPVLAGALVRIQLELPATGMTLEIDGRVSETVATGGSHPAGMWVTYENLNERSRADLEACADLIRRNQGRVLIVDDDIPFGQMLKQVLEEKDIGVLATTTPIPALSMLRAPGARFDVVVTDVVMPRMDGLEFAYTIREVPEIKEIPVLFVTGAQLDEEDWAAAARLGDMILKKPVDIDDFARIVGDLIESYRERTGGRDPLARGVMVQDPPNEKTTRLVRLADIAEKRLRALGVMTKRNPERTQVMGDLILQTAKLRAPFKDGPLLPRVSLLATGHDKVRIFDPPTLAGLPPVAFLDFSNQAELEAAFQNAFDRREQACYDSQRYLQSLKIGTRLDSEKFRCLGRFSAGANTLVFSMTRPDEISLVEVNGRGVADVLTRDDRRFALNEKLSGLDLEMKLREALNMVLDRFKLPR